MFFFFGKAFSQTDTLYKTEKIFSLIYIDSTNEVIEDDDLKLTYLDSNSLSFETSEYDYITTRWKPVVHNIKFDKINSFGYKIGTDKGSIIGRGALIGFGLGFILGAIEGKFNPVGDNSTKPSFGGRIGTGFLFGVAFAIPGTLIGLICSIPGKEYENVNLKKYQTAKKFEVIQRLIKKAIKINT